VSAHSSISLPYQVRFNPPVDPKSGGRGVPVILLRRVPEQLDTSIGRASVAV
jgi:hypothetical protein